MLGIIFYQTDTKTIKRLEAAIAFPSPYWGLFFYRQLEQEIYNLYVLVSVPILGIIFLSLKSYLKSTEICTRFRPHIGDYFFIGLYFYGIRFNLKVKFPSPYWGLFFIGYNTNEYYNLLYGDVSVPILGIIFYRCY